MIKPVAKRAINPDGVIPNRRLDFILLIQVNVPASSAVPNTAGMTVEKLSEEYRKY
jgi:hypothetical protein